MRHFHLTKQQYHCPIVNLDKIWTLVGEAVRQRTHGAACMHTHTCPNAHILAQTHIHGQACRQGPEWCRTHPPAAGREEGRKEGRELLLAGRAAERCGPEVEPGGWLGDMIL